MSYRAEALTWFSEQMAVKLAENEHKVGWNGCNPWWLLDRLKEEVAELADALLDASIGEGTPQEVIRECADIGNFAMMIADVINAKVL